jgi:hypothetical protein
LPAIIERVRKTYILGLRLKSELLSEGGFEIRINAKVRRPKTVMQVSFAGLVNSVKILHQESRKLFTGSEIILLLKKANYI